MKASNLRANQQTIADLQRMIKSGNSQLERHFEKLLQGGTPRSVEPLHFITKQKPFPVLSQDKITRLGLVHSYVGGIYRENMGGVGTPQESPAAKIYAEIRGPYLTATLSNLATASVSTAKKKDANAIYRAGTNGMGTYAQAMEGLFLAEYDNICSIFLREDWGPVFQATCQGALAELARTVRELNAHVKAHMSTDACLAYEIVEILSTLSNNLETRTGELKASLAATLRPVRETAKASLGELLDDIRRRVSALPTLPPDGAPVPVISETMQRLQAMVEFLRPISSIMISIGDGGWKSSASRSNAGAGLDGIPSLASFDVGADGRDIFAHFCADAIDTLLGALDARARAVHMGRSGGGIVGGVSVVGGVVGGGSGPSGGSLVAAKAVVGVFLANAVVIVERQVRDSDLAPLLLDSSGRLPVLEGWRKKATALYADGCKDVSTHLFDVIHTSRPTGGGGGAGRPTSGQGAGGIDSASILRGLSSKDKENIKNKFAAFNSGFDDLVARHKSYSMEREVRQLFARDVQQMLEPLYNRFWDRYHEIDKGKGKYVKYDRSSIAAVFLSLY